MMRKATLLGLGIAANLYAAGQTNRHNNLGQDEHLWKMKKIATHDFIAVGNGGSVVKYNDSCNDWLPLTLPANTDDFRNISFPTSSTGYISGPSNAFYKTINAGNSWTAIAAAATGLTNGSIQCVHFRDANTGFIAGSQIGVSGGGRFIKKTTNGGLSWTTVTPINIGTSTVYDMAFFNANTGIAVATNNKVFRTTDNGQTWTDVATTATLYSVAIAGSSNVAVGVANGAILRTADQGLTWSSIPTTASGLQGVHFYDALHGMITGNSGALLYTADAGLTWTAVSTLISTKLYDVQMTDTDKAVAVGANGIAIDIDLTQNFHRLFEEHFCHPTDSITYTGYTNTDNSGATTPRKWFFTNVNEDENGLTAAQWFPGNFAIYDAYYYEDVLLQHHSDSAVIETRTLNLSGVTTLSLDWNEAFYTHVDGLSKTRVQGFNGTAWITLYESTGMDFGDGVASAVFPTYKRAIDISALAGVTNAKLRFSYVAPNTNDGLKNFWAISDIVVSNRTTAVQLDDLAITNATTTCLDILPQELEVTLTNTGNMPVFPVELGWSSSDGQTGAAGNYDVVASGASSVITLIDAFTPPAAGGAITLKAWIKKLPNQNAANDTITRTFQFVPNAAGTALLGTDTAICPGSSIQLSSAIAIDNTLWSDGTAGNTLAVTTAGDYWISGTIGTCALSDTVTVSFLSIVTPVITQQGSSNLKVDAVYTAYQWYKDNVAIPNTNTAEIVVTQNGIYTVKAFTTEGCEVLSAAFTYNANGTGISNPTAGEMRFVVYPNPATSYINLSITDTRPQTAELTITDVLGKCLLRSDVQFTNGVAQVNTVALPAGIYNLQLSGKNQYRTTKFVKK